MPLAADSLDPHQALASVLLRNLEPTLGCTDPLTPALAAAAAAELLSSPPLRIKAELSLDLYKGAFAVGLPAVRAGGIPMALALGAAIASPGDGLLLFSKATTEHIERAKDLVNAAAVEVCPRADAPSIWARATVWSRSESAHAVVGGRHDRITLVQQGEAPLRILDEQPATSQDDTYSNSPVDFRHLGLDVLLSFVETASPEELRPVSTGIGLNAAACRLSAGSLPAASTSDDSSNPSIGAAVEAGVARRMSGEDVEVAAAFGSGNQGLVILSGISAMAADLDLPEERAARSAALGVLLAGAFNAALADGTPFCDCVLVAAPALAGAAAHLLGGDAQAVEEAIVATVSPLFGILCDGAKPACAGKARLGADAATAAAFNAVARTEPKRNRTSGRDWQRTYENLARVGSAIRLPAEQAMIDTLAGGHQSTC